MYNFTIVLQVLCVIAIFFVYIYLMTIKNYSFEHKVLVVGMAFLFVYNIAGFMEILCRTKEAAIVIMSFQKISMLQTMILMFTFIMSYCKQRIPKLLQIFLAAGDVFIIGTVLTCQMNTLYCKNMEFVEGPLYPGLVFESSLGDYLYKGILLFFAIYLNYISIKSFLKKSNSIMEKKRKISLVGATIFPGVLYILNIMGVLREVNFVTLSFLAASVFLIVSAYKFQLFDVIENGKEVILDTMDQAIVIIDKDYNFLYANKIAKQIFNDLWFAKEGIPIGEISPFVESCFRKGNESEFEIAGKYFDCQVTPVYDDYELRGYSACIINMTEKQKYMEKLIEMRNEADMANKAKSDFLANMSHEIRTPMNAIIGMSEIALRRDLDEEMRITVESIFNSGKSLLGIINNILDLSKIESGKIEIVTEQYYLDSVLYDVSNMTSVNLYGKPITYSAKIEEGVPNGLIGDMIRIKEILLNVLGNSVKYTKNGSICLEVSHKKKKRGIILCFKISDTGIGIEESNLEKIFGEYSRVDDEKNKGITGTGLGLAITKSLVDLMQGSIQVESKYGEGTTFYIEVFQEVFDNNPTQQREISMESMETYMNRDSLRKNDMIAFPQARILIVDDVFVNLQVAKGLMEPYDMTIECVSSGKEAIEAVKKEHFDLIFMDQMMPEMNGVETAKIIMSMEDGKYKDIPIVALTANAVVGAKEFFMQNGFSGFLSKPMNTKKLDEMLLRLLPAAYQVTKEAIDPYKNLEEPIEIQDVDTYVGQKNAGGKRKNYEEILKSFHREASQILKELNGYLEKNNLDLFRIKIHGIKGGARNIGAIALGNRAEEMETAAKGDDITFIQENLTGFKEKLEETLENIHHYFEKTKKKETVETEETVIGEDWWDSLQEAFQNYDMEKMESLLGEVKDKRHSPEIQEVIDRLEEYMEDLEYEKGDELIEAFRNKQDSTGQ